MDVVCPQTTNLALSNEDVINPGLFYNRRHLQFASIEYWVCNFLELVGAKHFFCSGFGSLTLYFPGLPCSNCLQFGMRQGFCYTVLSGRESSSD